MLCDVDTTSGISLAKIIHENDTTYTIMYMSSINKRLYDYEPICEIEKECVSGFYNEGDTEETAGFRKVEGGYVLLEDTDSNDDNYEPDDSESDDDDDDMSLVDESDSDS